MKPVLSWLCVFALLLAGSAEAGRFCSDATVVTIGQTVTGNLTTACEILVRESNGVENRYPAAEYTLNETAGKQLALSLSSSAFDTYLYFFSPQGTYLQDDDGGGGLNSRIPPSSGFVTLSQSGAYTVIVSSAYPSSSSQAHTGNYTLALTGTAPPPPAPTTMPAWEFYNTQLNHYFITAGAGEAQTLDSGGAGPGWTRTGLSFDVYPLNTPNTVPVCRFYGNRNINPATGQPWGPNSHLYVPAAECDYVRNNDPGWTYEGLAFNTILPDSGGCPTGTVPVMRAYNNRHAENDANHRYTADAAAYQQTISSGWVGEGTRLCTPGAHGTSTSSDSASATVSTGDPTTTISTGTGARVTIPSGAVAPKPDGTAGSATITIARDPSPAAQVPSGYSRVSDVYNLTPSGQYFQNSVAVTLPVTDPTASGAVSMLRFNSDGTVDNLGGEYNTTTRSITAQTNHFSAFAAALWNNNSTAAGCVNINNQGAPAYSWKNVCVSQVLSLTYPSSSTGQLSTATVSPDSCSSGWCDQVRWFLPQGSYRVCVEEWRRNTQSELPRLIGSSILSSPLDINQPWINTGAGSGPNCPATLNVQTLSNPATGGCACMGAATSGGTHGDVVVSLSWRSPSGAASTVDLDLHVTDPAGEEISYSHTTSASGGRLDYDNQCNGYQEGRTENIYWTTAPRGSYKVEVVFYNKCGSSPPNPQAFTVNVTANGRTTAYSGTISTASARGRVLVTNFSVP